MGHWSFPLTLPPVLAALLIVAVIAHVPLGRLARRMAIEVIEDALEVAGDLRREFDRCHA